MDSRANFGSQRSDGHPRRATRDSERKAVPIGRELAVPTTRETVEAGSVTDGHALSRLDRISQRAYAIYQARGGEHGRSLDDWLEAERQIDAEQR